MKYTFEIEINAPREKVADLFGNPANRKEWMEGLQSNEPVSGEPGMPGAKSQLVFKTGNVNVTFIATVTERNLLNDFTETMDASNVFTTVKRTFVVLSPQKTKYVSEQDSEFKGFVNKIVGSLLQGEFKRQTLTHMQNFKQFVEKS